MNDDALARYLRDQDQLFRDLEERAKSAEAPMPKKEVRERMRKSGLNLRRWASARKSVAKALALQGLQPEEIQKRLDDFEQRIAGGEVPINKPSSDG